MLDSGPIDLPAHRVLAGASRVRVLEYLRERGDAVTAPEVAEHVDLHPNTVRLHLAQLIDAGFVARAVEPPQGPGRPRVLYVAVAGPTSPAGIERHVVADDGYRTLAEILAAHFEDTSARVADDAADVGRAWGRSLGATSAPPSSPGGRPGAEPVAPQEATEYLVRVMGRLGFEPARPTPSGPIDLHRCPFQQVAEKHSRVVCGVHLGLMQGVLENLGAPVRATHLEPFVTPGLCRAHLAARPSPDGRPSTTHPLAPPIERPLP